MHMQSCDLPVINASALPAGKGGGRGRGRVGVRVGG